MQQEIIRALHVQPTIDPAQTYRSIVDFLKQYLVDTRAKGYVLGISGGQDSTLAGKITQAAVSELRAETGLDLQFIAMRLPYGVQMDEADCEDALAFIEPDQMIVCNIKPAVDAMTDELTLPLNKFHHGNVKARQRMIAQYAIAGQQNMLVIGTDHAAEAVTGFYTKWGDGAADVVPLTGLTKRQGKSILQYLNCPEHLYTKAPTADLEDDKPGLPDEVALGLTYDQIDDYLEGKVVDQEVAERIQGFYTRSAHKRKMPSTRFDS
ncbi:ammonia-dependent NAD(+) synthetase [Paenibacillus albiflavus]|uniref:NH(3)-dependent NAD(+) synthetase n=1 Tax=Paenibacillus albiflavus TaxID=2545760 RepID=A0A4R4ELG3_9BACL|nr:ammonia-dependent NAD(+) synthetase [Paenibacillus albiflavus]TCZ80190.1 ammonia-dependent NAD(+) synthetase [Paenibacillus albiflavus]